MRVAIANWSSRRVGGIEEYVAMLIPALHKAGHAVAFWHELDAPKDRGRIDVPLGVPDICAADSEVGPSLQALRDWRPDLIYVQGLTDVAVEGRLLEIAPSALFVHSYAGTCISGGKAFTRPEIVPCDRVFGWQCLAHYFPHGCGGRSPVTMWRQFRHQSDRLAMLRKYRAILTHTEHMKAEMARHGLVAHVVPYPVDVGVQTDARREGEEWRLLFAGRMDRLKGGAFLLDALPEVVAAVNRPVRLTFAGDGPERERWVLRASAVQAATRGLAIEFTGWIAQERVGHLMQDAHLLVVPSLWPEPFGTIGPEAGQHGVPAAAFDVGGISQWLGDGITGHLAPADPPTPSGLARAIVKCLEDAQHYVELCDGARKMAGGFTMERHLPQLVSSFERMTRAGK